MRYALSLTFIFFGTLNISAADEIANEGKSPTEQLSSGDHHRVILMGKTQRTAIIHVPPSYSPDSPTPVVLALHGAAMNATMMVSFCGLNSTADANGFIVVYPNGTGLGRFLTWNAGSFTKGLQSRADDVAFIRQLLDELGTVLSIDQKRVYATGMSNGGMMCYRLAAELSDRIASVAPVAGTMSNLEAHPTRPVSLIHFHGTLDTLVPFEKPAKKRPSFLTSKSVEDSVLAWVNLDGIDEATKRVEVISAEDDELKVTRQDFGPGKEGSEVVLITVEGGGHTWPGQQPPVKFLGKTAMTIPANDLMWQFFLKHPQR